MNPVHAIWWRLLDDARFGVRHSCARHRKLGAAGVALRWWLHLLMGNPAQVLVVVASSILVVLSPVPILAGLLLLALVVSVFEVWYQVRLIGGRGSWLHGWRLWWRVRRSIPSEWNESAVKSRAIKSALGGENRLSGLVRPIADHPKTGWWPRIAWPVASAWVGHPPGRTAKEYVEFQRVLAANILRVDNVEFDFARDRDSIGRIQITFVDVLSKPVTPTASAVDGLNNPPHLRIVGDAS